jgi:hypothetical protein
MKQILLTLTVLLFSLQSFCQGPANTALSKDEYLKKSKNQKKIAWILLGAGTVMAVGGYIVGSEYLFTESTTTVDIAAFTMLTGILSDLVSIGFFVSASNNKQRAARLAISNQKISIPHQYTVSFKMQPALTLKIPL